MMRKALALLAAFMFLAVSFGQAQEYPVLYDYVTDDAGIIWAEQDLEELCGYVYEMTGAQMAVLTVNSTYPDDINTFTVKTFQQNELGQEGKDNGLLLVIATDEELWRVEVGYGLEGILPDSKVGNYAETYLLPEIALGDYNTGIYDLMEAIGWDIIDNYEDAEPPKSPYPISFIPLTWTQWLIVIGIMVFLGVITKGRIFLFIPWIFTKGKIGGGGRSGGGGAGGKW